MVQKNLFYLVSALNEADYQLKGPDGTAKNVELGAVLWLYLDSPMGGSSK